MEDKTQRQLQQQEQEQLEQAQGQEQQSEHMKAIAEEEIITNDGASADDSSTYMSVQEDESELECIEADFETDYQSQAKSKQQHKHNQAHGKYSHKKSVSFKTLVDIFQLSDAWQLHVKKSSLKTEEDQAKRRILQRNY